MALGGSSSTMSQDYDVQPLVNNLDWTSCHVWMDGFKIDLPTCAHKHGVYNRQSALSQAHFLGPGTPTGWQSCPWPNRVVHTRKGFCNAVVRQLMPSDHCVRYCYHEAALPFFKRLYHCTCSLQLRGRSTLQHPFHLL